jgi:hypothetical protein
MKVPKTFPMPPGYTEPMFLAELEDDASDLEQRGHLASVVVLRSVAYLVSIGGPENMPDKLPGEEEDEEDE